MINEHEDETFLYDLQENDVLPSQLIVKTAKKEK